MKLLRHTSYNFLGLGLPLVVALFTIPVLVRELGDARFGLLTLIWAVTSYFGLFDLGLGRALTQQLATAYAKKEDHRSGPLAGTAALLLVILGVLAGVLMATLAPWGIGLIQDVPDRQEATKAVIAMAFAMPGILLTPAFCGVLESRYAFGTINLIRFPMGLLTFLGPLAVVLYHESPGLDDVAWVLVAGRVMGCAAFAVCAWRLLPAKHNELKWNAAVLKDLCRSGGWMTVSNVVSPFMGYVDRFAIGAMVSANAVAYYATPNEIVTKLWVVPAALTAVLFPTFAAQAAYPKEQTWTLFSSSVHGLYWALLPITVGLALFAHEVLAAWVGLEFAGHSATLLQVFAIGIFVNCVGHVPYSLIQGRGAARRIALVHTAELPLFIAALWVLISNYGVWGAAIAWLMRIVVDSLLMFGLCSPLLGRPAKSLLTPAVLGAALFAAAAFAGMWIEPLGPRFVWLVVLVCASVFRLLASRRAMPVHIT